MNAFDDGNAPDDADEPSVDPVELERSVTPPEDTAITPELLDELFETEDPRVQSGNASDDSDDDLDFIRMSGLTSPEISADIDAIDEIISGDKPLADPVSFYEPGVADVDAAMVPDSKPAIEVEDPAVDENDTLDIPEISDSIVAQTDEPTVEDQPEEASAAADDSVGDSLDLSNVTDLEDPPEETILEAPVVGEDTAAQIPEADVAIPIEDTIPEIAEKPSSDLTDEPALIEDESDSPLVLEDAEVTSAAEEPASHATAEDDFVDLDELDEDEVFSDLVSPDVAASDVSNEQESTTIDSNPEVHPGNSEDMPEEQMADASEVSELISSTDAEDAVDSLENVEVPIEADSDDETLIISDEPAESESVLDDSIFDGILAETDSDVLVDESQTEESAPPTPDAKTTPNVEPEDSYDDLTTVQSYGRRSSHHHRRHQPFVYRLLKVAAVFLVFGAALAYGGYEAYRWFEIRVSNPTTLYYEAESAAASLKPLEASRLYEEFVRRNPEHPLAADAMFAAGYQMQQVDSEDSELAQQYSEESLALLGEFARRHPKHQRVGRAQSLMGIIHYRSGNYRAAVDALIDRDAMLRDPAATLPMLRTLARSYAQLGEYEAAHSTFIRAANSPGNPSPDADYDELGEMYRALAQTADSPDRHMAFHELALEHWSHAIRYPGINPTRKNAIRVKVDLLSELGVLKGTPPAVAVQAQNSGVVVPLEDSAEVRQATFELTSPLPFGPIIRGVPGNDELDPIIPATTVKPAPIEIDVVPVALPEGDVKDLTSGPDASKARHHEIAQGEQLIEISLKYGVSPEQLLQWNQIEDPDHIQAGQRLMLHAPGSSDE